METGLLQDLLVLFGFCVFAVVLFHRLNLPPVLGFLVTGMVCGPFGLQLVKETHQVEMLAEIGLVLLLFTIGMEFSIQTFLKLKRFLLIAGGLQVVTTIAVTALLSHFFGFAWPVAVFFGMLTTLSSTAIVVRILQYRDELDSTSGRSALSILIFQDLVIVPMVLLTPFLGNNGGKLADVAMLTGKAVSFLVVAALLARFLVPWILTHVARTQKREAFVLTVFMLCLGTGLATAHVGLSMALGAFVAGLVISESAYNHQALAEIVPFREVFNCLVFVSIGMFFNVQVLLSQPYLILGLLLALILVKAFTGIFATMAAGHSLKIGLLTGLALAQMSEFSFVLAKCGLEAGILTQQLSQLFMAVAILSMFVTPTVISKGTMLVSWLVPRLPARWNTGMKEDEEKEELSGHVIILGYGYCGQKLGSVLHKLNISYIAVEDDPQVVEEHKKKGTRIFYGDGATIEILEHAGVEKATVLAVTIADMGTAQRAIQLARLKNSQLHIIGRGRSVSDSQSLLSAGANEVAIDEFVGAIDLFARVLHRYSQDGELDMPALINEQAQVYEWITGLSRKRPIPDEELFRHPLSLSIQVCLVSPQSAVAGMTLQEARFRNQTGAIVVAIRGQDGNLASYPGAEARLQAGGMVVMVGQPEDLSKATGLLEG